MVLWWRMNWKYLILSNTNSYWFIKSDNINHNISSNVKNVSQNLGLYEKKEELYQQIEDFNEKSFHFLNLHADEEASVSSQEDKDKDLDDEKIL